MNLFLFWMFWVKPYSKSCTRVNQTGNSNIQVPPTLLNFQVTCWFYLEFINMGNSISTVQYGFYKTIVAIKLSQITFCNKLKVTFV